MGSLLKAICADYSEELTRDNRAIDEDEPATEEKTNLGPVQIQTYKMGQKETTALATRAMHEKVSVYSAVCASLVTLRRDQSAAFKDWDLRLFAPFDLRRRLGIDSSLMLALSLSLVSIPRHSSTGFWEFARYVDELIDKTHTHEHIVQTASALGLALRYNPTPAKLAAFCNRSFGFHFVAAQLEEVCVNRGSVPLELLSVWGPSILIGPPGAQSIGISTANSELHLLRTSYDPHFNSLGEVASFLSVACTS